ncbi:hypothetical protein PHYPSEUDO_004302 [Phytophthora pseudosyringae]|uniref:Uncharacterized protein n=1 Tax=Phytophthora pseudosyringae TaxID=221518 RepID=A0A8T1VNW8_9STRA|nr:hypothetical protein PHYPSEUDO_004302 [Phytophthora pseudosyringae]
MASEPSPAETTVTGVTAFAPAPAPTYRYTILSESEKLTIQLEDEDSGALSEGEYMTCTNRIANCTTADYTLIFKDALDYLMVPAAVSDTSSDASTVEFDSNADHGEEVREFETPRIRRKLVLLENQVLQLELTVKVKVLRSAWGAKYVFQLQPLSRDELIALKPSYATFKNGWLRRRNS